MAQPPGTGSEDQVVRLLAALALSPAFQTEVQTAKANVDLSYTLRDAKGAQVVLNLTDVAGPPLADLSWIRETIQAVEISAGETIEPPYPRLQLLARPGAFQRADGGADFRNEVVVGEIYHIDATILVAQDMPHYAEREALILARCFQSLIRRNETLGGLVQLIQPRAPIEVETQTAKPGDVAGARCNLEAHVLQF